MGALQLDPVVSVLTQHIQHIKSADRELTRACNRLYSLLFSPDGFASTLLCGNVKITIRICGDEGNLYGKLVCSRRPLKEALILGLCGVSMLQSHLWSEAFD